jgi:L-fucose dehydrogenase
MNLNLKDKVVIVTGGAKGIGEAIVKVLADEGAIPVIVGRNEADNKTALATINGKGMQIVAELNDPKESKKTIDATIKQYGKIDALVNNAGVNDSVGLETGTPEEFEKSLQKNLVHYYSMAHYALPHLKKTTGSIINISSKVAVTGQGATSGYASSKGGINSLTREWAAGLLPYGIRVNAVIPAEVWTPLYEKWINTLPNPKEKLDQIVSNIPLGKRFTTSEEIANMVVFLLSDRSSHTTGQLIYVDGGYTHLDRGLT